MNRKDLNSSPSRTCCPDNRQANAEDATANAADSANSIQSLDGIREQLGEYLTRRQAAAYIRDILGRPLSFSTASKLAALGEFAPAALWWGRRPLYTRDDLRAWAEERSRPTKQRNERAAVPESTGSTPLPTC
jgi:hypothetical protein